MSSLEEASRHSSAFVDRQLAAQAAAAGRRLHRRARAVVGVAAAELAVIMLCFLASAGFDPSRLVRDELAGYTVVRSTVDLALLAGLQFAVAIAPLFACCRSLHRLRLSAILMLASAGAAAAKLGWLFYSADFALDPDKNGESASGGGDGPLRPRHVHAGPAGMALIALMAPLVMAGLLWFSDRPIGKGCRPVDKRRGGGGGGDGARSRPALAPECGTQGAPAYLKGARLRSPSSPYDERQQAAAAAARRATVPLPPRSRLQLPSVTDSLSFGRHHGSHSAASASCRSGGKSSKDKTKGGSKTRLAEARAAAKSAKKAEAKAEAKSEAKAEAKAARAQPAPFVSPKAFGSTDVDLALRPLVHVWRKGELTPPQLGQLLQLAADAVDPRDGTGAGGRDVLHDALGGVPAALRTAVLTAAIFFVEVAVRSKSVVAAAGQGAGSAAAIAKHKKLGPMLGVTATDKAFLAVAGRVIDQRQFRPGHMADASTGGSSPIQQRSHRSSQSDVPEPLAAEAPAEEGAGTPAGGGRVKIPRHVSPTTKDDLLMLLRQELPPAAPLPAPDGQCSLSGSLSGSRLPVTTEGAIRTARRALAASLKSASDHTLEADGTEGTITL